MRGSWVKVKGRMVRMTMEGGWVYEGRDDPLVILVL